MAERVLCVDDDPLVLAGFQRNLRRRFELELEVAVGGEAALAEGPYAVVVSDLRMPAIDGVRLLAAVRERWPDTVRVMLTGESDVAATIAADNSGTLFRFLTKPCTPDGLAVTLEAALAQHRLGVAERDLASGMVIDEDARTVDGLLLVARGQEATQAVIERVRNYARQVGIVEPFRVLVPGAQP